MASPTASLGGRNRRRQTNKRQSLSRTNTLFGAIKNIVTAPLSWFASTDDFEDTRDNTGKRRRLTAVPTEPVLDEEESAPRTKRMRVHSPPRELQREGAYLEPPSSMFQQPPSIGRSVSTGTQTNSFPIPAVGNTSSYVRSTLSPLRNLSISRTMSIDPPPRPQSQDRGAFQSQRHLSSHQDGDSSMESIHALPLLSAPTVPSFSRTSHSMPRDLSMPYSRPTFRMRTSLTPQPAQIQRERSEPPSVQLLRTHPTFVKPPPLQEEDRVGSAEPAPTLGSFVESVRQTQSPARQHGSLLFGGKTQAEAKPEASRGQRALHELEIYKTPLVPTRLRSSLAHPSITGVPDLFKPRRKLVLMKDEQLTPDHKLGRKEVVSPGKNDTKPYAGEGGIKKMLAKRKLELEEEEHQPEDAVEEKKESKGASVERELQTSAPAREPPPPLNDDWYSLASGSSGSNEVSSLRVGRAKRNHIARPTARSRTKFSAAFEDDGDDAMADQEKEMLEEAAKKAPVFNIPAGFSFANNVKPIEHDTSNAKEPPIKSLPFSLSAVSSVPKPEATVSPPTPALFGSTPAPEKSMSMFVNPPAAATPEKPMAIFGNLPTASSSSQPSGESSSKGVPNFFARPEAFTKPLEIKTAPLLFGSSSTELPKPNVTPTPAPSTPVFRTEAAPATGDAVPDVSSSTTSFFGSPAPVKDSANPLWDGERTTGKEVSLPGSTTEQPRPASMFGTTFRADSDGRPKAVSGMGLFGNIGKNATSQATPSSGASPNIVIPVVVGTGREDKGTMLPGPNASAPPTFFSSEPTSEGKPDDSRTPVPVSTDQTPMVTAPIVATNPAPLDASMSFSASTTDAPKSFTPVFGATPNPATEPNKSPNIFGASSSTPSTGAFSFGKPSSSGLSVEAPQPLVSNGAFSFGASASGETKSTSPAPFSFGAQNARETNSSSPAPFSFGVDKGPKSGSPAPFNLAAPSTPHATEKATPFSFGTPPASPIPPPVFTFGAGGNTAGAATKPSQADRPVTPPKNNDQEFKMEESPTRDVQQTNNDNKPLFGGFAFGTQPTSGSVLFGGPTSAPPVSTAPFPFSSGASSNPFSPQPIKESKSEGMKPYSFGQSSTSSSNTGFNFGQTSTAADSPRPSTSGSFNVTGPGTPTSTTPAFSFGATPTNNPFGQSSGGSAPSSPSTFQSSAFNFGAPSGGGFSFGSQPASPATGATNLPPAATPVTFGGTNTGFGSAPSSPFTAPTQITPSTSSGGTLFTIGAAPPPQTGGQSRVIKKLPNRTRAKR